jgi:hypothetical protein
VAIGAKMRRTAVLGMVVFALLLVAWPTRAVVGPGGGGGSSTAAVGARISSPRCDRPTFVVVLRNDTAARNLQFVVEVHRAQTVVLGAFDRERLEFRAPRPGGLRATVYGPFLSFVTWKTAPDLRYC